MAKTDKNISTANMIVRIVLGVIVLYLGFTYSWYWYILAAYLLITGIMRYSPIYTLFKKK